MHQLNKGMDFTWWGCAVIVVFCMLDNGRGGDGPRRLGILRHHI